ncbi:hypothetical protein CSUI_010906 [Cystoisospora suis]|uniref:Transmembrane protein n=1 Tax=Cystoisospora suis TaxID=483139 RepID=A0A2C6KFU4_9APIC|nr:hypothetical protein CSUI_010906 [Cystoisospora suis]
MPKRNRVGTCVRGHFQIFYRPQVAFVTICGSWAAVLPFLSTLSFFIASLRSGPHLCLCLRPLFCTGSYPSETLTYGADNCQALRSLWLLLFPRSCPVLFFPSGSRCMSVFHASCFLGAQVLLLKYTATSPGLYTNRD